VLRVLYGLDVEHCAVFVQAPGCERPVHDLGQLLQQHRARRAGVDRPAAGWEPDRHARLDVVLGHDHRGARQNDLGGALYLDPPATARSPVTAHDLA
jgi:hypothetical protein